MPFLKRLKALLKYEDVSGLLIYSLISIILLFLSIEFPILFLVFILFVFYQYRNNKILFFYTIILCTLFIISFIIFSISFKYLNENITSIKGIVIDKKENYLIVKRIIFKYKYYYKESSIIKIGSVIKIDGVKFISNERNLEGTYNYSKYKLSKGIVSELNTRSIKIISENKTIYSLKQFLIDYIDKSFSLKSSEYLKCLVLGISSFDEELNESIQSTGIIFLFCISGLHISILTESLRKVFRSLNIYEEVISILLIIILFIYMMIVSSSVSIKRAIIMVSIKEVLSITRNKLSKMDILSISFFIISILNPFSLYEVGLYLTYLSTFIIYLSKKANSFVLSRNVIIFTTPLIIYSNHSVSLFIYVFSLVFGEIFTTIFIPFTYLTLIFKPLGFIYDLLTKYLSEFLEILSKSNVKIEYSFINIYYLLLAYFILFLIFKNRRRTKSLIKYLISFGTIVLLNYVDGNFSFYPQVKYIDVGQGDSIFIQDGFNKFLIDTGPLDRYSSTVSYFKSQNIHSLNYIFISHFDTDHSGELDNITKSISVKNIVYGLNNSSLKIGRLNFDFYSCESNNDNDSSMVILMNVYNKSFLFTGDIESIGEDNIIREGISNITYLKVAHHGSASSSKIELLNKLNPRFSIISVGVNNRYGHPSKDVIDRLERINSTIFRTDIDGSINVSIHRFYSYINCYRKDSLNIFRKIKSFYFYLK